MFADGFLLRKPKDDEIWQTESTKVTCLVCCWRTEQERWMSTMRWQERREDVQKSMMFDLTYEKQMENAKREWHNDGVEEGVIRQLAVSIVKKVKKNKTLEEIADELEESIETIQPIYDVVKKHAPEYDVDAITAEVLEVRNK